MRSLARSAMPHPCALPRRLWPPEARGPSQSAASPPVSVLPATIESWRSTTGVGVTMPPPLPEPLASESAVLSVIVERSTATRRPRRRPFATKIAPPESAAPLPLKVLESIVTEASPPGATLAPSTKIPPPFCAVELPEMVLRRTTSSRSSVYSTAMPPPPLFEIVESVTTARAAVFS